MNDQHSKLDNPVWWSLSTCHRDRCKSRSSAYVMKAEFGPFAAISGNKPGAIQDFISLVEGRACPALTFSTGAPFGASVKPAGLGVQFVPDCVLQPWEDPGIEVLTDRDAFQQYDLAKRAPRPV